MDGSKRGLFVPIIKICIENQGNQPKFRRELQKCEVDHFFFNVQHKEKSNIGGLFIRSKQCLFRA